MEVLPRGHGGARGATAVHVRCHGGHGGYRGDPLRIGPTGGGTVEVLNMFNVSAVPPRRSAFLTVFGGTTANNDGTTAEPLRNHGGHDGATAVYVVQAPQWHCAFGVTGVLRVLIRPIQTSRIQHRNSKQPDR